MFINDNATHISLKDKSSLKHCQNLLFFVHGASTDYLLKARFPLPSCVQSLFLSVGIEQGLASQAVAGNQAYIYCNHRKRLQGISLLQLTKPLSTLNPRLGINMRIVHFQEF